LFTHIKRMNYVFYSAILIVGLSGLAAQVLILRELLVSFYGNELTIGIVLANWMALEALGVFIIGKAIDKIRDKISLFIVLEIIFSLALPISIYLSRDFKNILGITYGEGIGLYQIFFVSLLILLPASFTHGALFSAGCRIYSSFIKESAESIGEIYSWETIGTLLGGITLTYFFIPYLNTFRTVFVIAIANLLVSFLLIRKSRLKLKYITLAVLLLAVYVFAGKSINKINRISIDRQYRIGRVLDYQNSIYGNVTVTKSQEQYTFFYNGIPIITAPYPNKQFVEDFGHLPLLFHQAPRDILVIAAGAGGLINEIFKHPVSRLDYVELDPLLIKKLKKFPTVLTESEIKDKRTNIINQDGRFYLKTAPHIYDIIMIGLSNQANLSTNRLFTREFFALAKAKLNPKGVLAFWLPGSYTFLSTELKNINSCILSSLNSTFDYVRIIPGDYNIFLASTSKDIMAVTPDLLYRRLSEQNIQSNVITPAYLEERLSNQWLDWFKESIRGALEAKNQDLKPIAVFQSLILWNREFSPKVANVLKGFENLDLKSIIIFMILATIFIHIIFHRKSGKRPFIAYSIFTTGFFAMLSNLILIFSYQVFYGYLYHRIGLLVSIFMAGIALGSICMTFYAKKAKNAIRLLLSMESLMIIFSFVLALILTHLLWHNFYSSLIFIALFFISGLLTGLEFPLASKIYLGKDSGVGSTAGALYGADLLGGWVAGITGSIILIPVLGVYNTCIVMLMFKLSSLSLLTFLLPQSRKS
jgi:spermidine synthase